MAIWYAFRIQIEAAAEARSSLPMTGRAVLAMAVSSEPSVTPSMIPRSARTSRPDRRGMGATRGASGDGNSVGGIGDRRTQIARGGPGRRSTAAGHPDGAHWRCS